MMRGQLFEVLRAYTKTRELDCCCTKRKEDKQSMGGSSHLAFTSGVVVAAGT